MAAITRPPPPTRRRVAAVRAILLIVLITLLRGLFRPVPVIPGETTTAHPITTAAPQPITLPILRPGRFQAAGHNRLRRASVLPASIGCHLHITNQAGACLMGLPMCLVEFPPAPILPI